jgi:hypothetical protein
VEENSRINVDQVWKIKLVYKYSRNLDIHVAWFLSRAPHLSSALLPVAKFAKKSRGALLQRWNVWHVWNLTSYMNIKENKNDLFVKIFILLYFFAFRGHSIWLALYTFFCLYGWAFSSIYLLFFSLLLRPDNLPPGGLV